MAPPDEWGPPAWYLIFTIIDDMPDFPSDTEYYRMFFESLQGVLPCRLCRAHYTQHIQLYPPPVWSKQAMYAWAKDLQTKIHNNKKRGLW